MFSAPPAAVMVSVMPVRAAIILFRVAPPFLAGRVEVAVPSLSPWTV
jgi:hypothetical protein